MGTASVTGTITLAFSDIEGSTRLLQILGDQYADLLVRQRQIVRAVVEDTGGRVIQEIGDGFFLSFARARDAIEASAAIQRTIAATDFPGNGPVRVRMGLHTGEPAISAEGFIGLDVHRAARICSAAVGGQVLLSSVTADLARQELPGGVGIRDLGIHRLKDLHEPEHLFQLEIDGLRCEFPPPRTLEARRFNFPTPPTPMIGREHDMHEIFRLLHEGRARLVTLTGPGGTGKTRLSLAVADLAADRFDDGAAFVPLAPLNEPARIPSVIASALGLRESVARSTFDVIVEHLREREMLLVLDNFEQIVDGAAVVADLLAACPGVTVLVTSRIVLRLRGEHEFPVSTLVLPDLDALAEPEVLRISPAVMLFVERARAVRPEFDLDHDNARAVAELCTRLDGLPLALELAAARIRLFTPQALLARLGRRLDLLQGGARDLPERHQTLRAAIGWSYDLLDPEEKSLFRALSVFATGFTLEHAEAMCARLDDTIDVIEGLGSLVERSLVRRESDLNGESRFGMLETVRAFGLEALDLAEQSNAVREAHARVMLELATTAEPHLAGPEQQHWLDRLAADHDNLRAACAWLAQNDGEAALRMCAALYRFWIVRGHLREGRSNSERVLSLPGAAARTPARARVTFGLGTFHHETGAFAEARTLLEESLAIATELGDDARIADASNGVGWVVAMVGDAEAGRSHVQHALEIYRRLGNRRGEAVALHNLALASFWMGDLHDARSLYADAIAIMNALGDRRGTAYYNVNLGWIDAFQGRFADAAARFEEAAVTFSMLRDTQLIGWAFTHQAKRAFLLDEVDAAIRTFDEALSLWREVGNRFGIAWTLCFQAAARVEKGELERAAASIRESLAIWKESGSARGNATLCIVLLPYIMKTGDTTLRAALVECLESLARIRDYNVMIEVLDEALPCLPGRVPKRHAEALLALAERESQLLQRVRAGRYERNAKRAAELLKQPDADLIPDDGSPPPETLMDAMRALAETFRR